MATLQDFGQTMPVNRRTAQLQAEQQAAQRAAQMKINQEIGQTVGSRTKYDQPFQVAPKVPTSKALQNAQNVYTNKAAGLDSVATGTPGASVFDQRTVTASSPEQQMRMQAMRDKGMTEAQIASRYEQPKIEDRLKRAGDEAVRRVKPSDPAMGIDPYREEQVRQAAIAAEAAKVQAEKVLADQEDQRKKSYTPTVDPNVNAAKIEMENTKNTITQDLKGSNDYIDQLDSSLSNLSPLLQEAGKSFISYAKGRAADLQKSFESQLAFVPTEEEITAQYAGQEADIRKNKELLLGIADRNKKLQEDIATYNRDMMLADKAMIEHENNAALFKQAKANTDNERKLRRQLGRLGLNTDLQSLQFLDDAIQEGQTIYDNLRISGDLSLIKANLAIGQGYMLDMTKAINDHDSAVATILANAEQELKTVKNAIGTAKSDRLKTIRDLIGKREENKAELEGKLADKIFELNKEMSQQLSKENESKKKEAKDTGDKLSFTSGLRKEIEAKKTVIQAKEVQGFVNVANVAYDRYTKLLAEIKSGKSKSEALSPAQTAVVTSLAKILDPGSVVRNEEYERQARGQGFIDRVTNLYDQFKSGSQFSPRQVEEMWSLANDIQDSWQERLSSEIQPILMDIADWNTSYPDAFIPYKQVVPNIDSLPLMRETFDTWAQQANDTSNTGGFPPSSSPNGWRTDRHNNPIAFAVRTGKTNEFTDALDNAGIQWSYGDPFPENKNMVTVRINNKDDAVEASRAVLANSNALQNWYLSPKRPYASSLKQFGIQNNQDFANLPRSTQDQVIATIYKGEVGDGSLIGLSPTPTAKRKSYSLVPTAEAASPDDAIYIEGDDGEDDTDMPTLSGGSALQPRIGANISGGLVGKGNLATYRNTRTGKDVQVAIGSEQEKLLIERGGHYKVESTKTSKAKPIILAGKTLPQ